MKSMVWKELEGWKKAGIILSFLYLIYIIGVIIYTTSLCNLAEENTLTLGGLCKIFYFMTAIPWIFIFGFSWLSGYGVYIFIAMNFALLFLISYIFQKIIKKIRKS